MKDVSRDAYMAWKDNEVTKAFMAEIAEDLKDVTEMQIHGTAEKIVMQSHERNAMMDVYSSVINWKPSNLIEEN